MTGLFGQRRLLERRSGLVECIGQRRGHHAGHGLERHAAASAGTRPATATRPTPFSPGGAWHSSGMPRPRGRARTSSSFSASSPFNASYDDGQGNAMSALGNGLRQRQRRYRLQLYGNGLPADQRSGHAGRGLGNSPGDSRPTGPIPAAAVTRNRKRRARERNAGRVGGPIVFHGLSRRRLVFARRRLGFMGRAALRRAPEVATTIPIGLGQRNGQLHALATARPPPPPGI